MNYPFRDLIINLLNGHRSSQDVAHQLMTLQENYPKDIFYNNLNNLGTHDTERILTMVGEKNLSVALAMLLYYQEFLVFTMEMKQDCQVAKTLRIVNIFLGITFHPMFTMFIKVGRKNVCQKIA